MADVTKETNPPVGAVEDRGGLRDAGGPPQHSPNLKVGQRVPGPADQTVGSVGPFPEAGFDADRVELLETGGPERFDLRGVTVGELLVDRSRLSGRRSAVEDLLVLEGTGGKDYHTAPPIGAGELLGPPGAVEDELYYKLQADGLPMDWGDVTPDGTRPRLTTVHAGGGWNLPGGVVRATFNSVMRTHPTEGGLLTPQNYTITEVSTGRRLYVQQVVLVDTQTVDLYTEELPPFVEGSYILVVKNVQDQNGDVIDPAYDTVAFSARGTDLPAGTELHVFAGLYTGIQSDNASGVSPDISPPELQDLDPPEGAAIVPVDSNVFIKIHDTESNLNLNSVHITLNRGGGWEEVWKDDLAQPGFPTLKSVIDPQTVTYDVDPAIDFNTGITVQVRVRVQDTAPLPNALDKTYTFDIFDPTGFMTVVHTSDLELQVTFVEAMQTAGAPGVALANPLSYQLRSNSGIGLPGPGPFYPSGVNVVSPTVVRLTIPYTTRLESFRCLIVGALETLTGSLITGAYKDFDSNTSLPRVSQIEMIDGRTMRITFNREMKDNADLINPSAYQITGPGGLSAEIVSRISPNVVRVILNRPTTPGEYYLLSVKAEP